jgi:imidazolonepropionase-like amidohydrolase
VKSAVRRAACAIVLAALPVLAQAQQLAIVGVTIIDPSSSGPSAANQTIVVDRGVIRAVGPLSTTRVPDGARVINARGKFAIPGLWDAHVHFMNAGVTALPLLLAHGVTSVREMGGHLDSTLAWRARMQAGALVGPRIMTSGPILESPRYLQGVRDRSARLDGRLAIRVLPYRIGVGDAAEARVALDSLQRLGVDFVKIRTVASAESYFAILREAKRVGLVVTGHQPGGIPLRTASDSGQKSIEHGFFPPTSRFGQPTRDSLYSTFARNGTWYTPTLVVSRVVMLKPDSGFKAIFGDSALVLDEKRPYATPWLLEWWRMQVDERLADTSSARITEARVGYESSVQDVRGMQRTGVRMLAGTDAGSVLVYPGFSLHEELRLMVEDAGLTPREALWTATVGPAVFFGLESTLGTIAAGKSADIVLLDADPLADIRNTRRIFTVLRAGRVFDRVQLDALLQAIRDEAARPPAVRKE